MPYLAMKLVFEGIVNRSPWLLRFVVKRICKRVNSQYLNPNLLRELRFIEETLQTDAWFAGGQFTAADIFMGFMLEAVAGRMAPATTFPQINHYVARIRLRPAYQRAMERGNWSVAEHNKYWAFLAE